jgi:hypothetical protein
VARTPAEVTTHVQWLLECRVVETATLSLQKKFMKPEAVPSSTGNLFSSLSQQESAMALENLDGPNFNHWDHHALLDNDFDMLLLVVN